MENSITIRLLRYFGFHRLADGIIESYKKRYAMKKDYKGDWYLPNDWNKQ